MLQNSFSQWRKKATNPFIFDEVKEEFRQTPKIKSSTAVLVSTKSTANEYLPFPSNFEFNSCFLPTKFEKYAENIRFFKVRKDDVWILSFPYSGENSIQNIIWQLKNGLNEQRESNFNGHFLEKVIFETISDDVKKTLDSLFRNALEKLDEVSSPRIIKSHLPPHLLPIELWTIQPRIIYISRDPKDVATLMFQHLQNEDCFTGRIQEFFDLFRKDEVWYAPFHYHLINFRNMKQLDHFLSMKYEDIKENRFDEIKKICKFLNYTKTDDEVKEIANRLVSLRLKNINYIFVVLIFLVRDNKKSLICYLISFKESLN